jgi:hypothetical protein
MEPDQTGPLRSFSKPHETLGRNDVVNALFQERVAVGFTIKALVRSDRPPKAAQEPAKMEPGGLAQGVCPLTSDCEMASGLRPSTR